MDPSFTSRKDVSPKSSLIRKQRPGCLSRRSVSMGSQQREETPDDALSLSWDGRLTSPEPRFISMKSDHSMLCPFTFTSRDSGADPSTQDEGLMVSSDRHFESIFEELEHKVISLVKRELERFKQLLSPKYLTCSDRAEEDEEDENSARQGALKITLHVLRGMNLSHLATTLQIKSVPFQRKLKSKLNKKCQIIKEGISSYETSALLSEIYTELYITEGGSGEINNEHEVRQIEAASRRRAAQETPINCNDIFNPLPGQVKPIRTVLTKGVAGIGKTVSVQKFILDWVEGKANQDVHFIFPLPFRELNLIKEKNLSLMELLHSFFTETKELELTNYKTMFVFDGLDECRLPLDFQNNEGLFDVTKSASVDVLLTNLIKGNLLPSALLWITSRPAAVSQVPSEFVDQVTEVRGFSDPQKEEYFKKRISDESLANRIITHMKSSRSLYIMCHIPVFCWIAATVLERMLGEAESREIPKTLTQMFTHFLIFQTKHASQKYHSKSTSTPHQTKETILALGKLAFQQMEKGNLIFYEEDLRECGIDVKEVSVYSGVCTQVFTKEFGLHLGKVFSFVHLSVQEFLAALFVFLTFLSNNRKGFEKCVPGFVSFVNKPTMSDLLKSAVDKALESENGHLDLFLRFLLGLSLESNQISLKSLLPQTGISSPKVEIIKYIKKMIKDNSSEKSINLFHCLNELNDYSLEKEVQTYLCRKGKNRLSTSSTSGHLSGPKLSPAQWSAVVFVLLTSEADLKEFNLSKYDPSEECLQRMLPVVRASIKANLSGCNLTEMSCAILASALGSSSSHLTELDLSTNHLQDRGVKLLSDGLENSQCKLERLRLCGCGLTGKSCSTLVFALSSNSSNLKELNVSDNNLHNSGVMLLCTGVENPHCKLEILGLNNCSITEEGCAALTSALQKNPSHLRELGLSMNLTGDLGIKLLSTLLKHPDCKLEKLELCDCRVTEEGCAVLAAALTSNPSSHMRELDLGYNKLGDSDVKQLSALLEDPQCSLNKLYFSM